MGLTMRRKSRHRARQRARALLAACALFAGVAQPAPRLQAASFGGSFHLVNAGGKPVTDQDFRGRFLLVFFGYTPCPDLCPTMLYTIAQALHQMGAQAGSVQPLFITVDPARDSPAIIGSYVALFSPRIIGLSGSAAELRQAEQDYHIYVGPTDPKTGAITHSAMLYIMAPDGGFLTALSGNQTAAGLAAQLRQIIAAN
jgi:cytochrome oxidase Cu insertion factor (SCO1/SenC/PrrC family)